MSEKGCEVLHGEIAYPGCCFCVTVLGLFLPRAGAGGAWQDCGVLASSLCPVVYSPLGPVFTPPVKDGQDPFETGNLGEDLGYHVKMKDGVVYIYGDKAAVGRKEPKDLPYPCLEHFVDDMNFLLALIAQGPV